MKGFQEHSSEHTRSHACRAAHFAPNSKLLEGAVDSGKLWGVVQDVNLNTNDAELDREDRGRLNGGREGATHDPRPTTLNYVQAETGRSEN